MWENCIKAKDEGGVNFSLSGIWLGYGVIFCAHQSFEKYRNFGQNSRLKLTKQIHYLHSNLAYSSHYYKAMLVIKAELTIYTARHHIKAY